MIQPITPEKTKGQTPEDACPRLDLSRALAEVLLEEVEYLGPTIHGLLLAVGRRVIVEEGVAGAIVAVEVVGLARCLQRRFVRVDLVRRRVLIVVAEQAEHGAVE